MEVIKIASFNISKLISNPFTGDVEKRAMKSGICLIKLFDNENSSVTE